ncbi:SPI-1 type III secretion system effector inositol phosphate phosphatase SopB [Kistimonas scapharcae]|uniref:SPI-1 type III secretion system effector inositol phosphate phosphatase SopB n=1 Tax=Kistimonas scapharcae TaxID=1036133 RepID=A0ABP8VC85_9GAMM
MSLGALNEIRIRNLLVAIELINENRFMSPPLLALRDTLEIELQRLLTASEQDLAHEPVTDKSLIREVKAHPQRLRKRLVKAGYPPQDLKALMKSKIIRGLNQKKWQAVKGTIENRSLGILESQQTPAAEMRSSVSNERDFFPVSYQGGGISSLTITSADHAVNLWTSSLRSRDTGHVLYQGVRHGIHSAYGMEGDERKIANLQRAKESLLAALSLRPDLLQQAFAHPEKSVHLDLVSSSLVTPDLVRSGLDNEKRMLADQIEAFSQLTGKQPIKLDIMGPDGSPLAIRLTTRMLCFNFGVNYFAIGPSVPDVLVGWDVSDALNRKSLESLIGDPEEKTDIPGGWVMEYINSQAAKLEALESRLAMATPQEFETISDRIVALRREFRLVRQLERQIRTIFQKGLHHKDGGEAYKMPSRILLLTHLLKGIPLSNCKSGKDRTGMLDAEVKFLAARCELRGEVPEPGAPLTPEEQELWHSILLNSGNLEIQEYNTGLQGYKTEDIKSIDKRIGNESVRREVRGASGAAAS